MLHPVVRTRRWSTGLLAACVFLAPSCGRQSATVPSILPSTTPTSGPPNCHLVLGKGSVMVSAGETLSVSFAVPPTTGTDYLNIEVDYLPNPIVPGASLLCRLYDGDRLLDSGACHEEWQSVDASLHLPNTPQIDFSSIQAGTSTARLDFVVQGGQFGFDLSGYPYVGRLIPSTVPPRFVDVMLVAPGTVSSFVLAQAGCH
jgi:hypothetical protein